jgi:uncharacterized membrane protein YgdD (TMEM256/DUF423 family)
MNKIILFTACFLGMLSVILGAYAAHGLEKIINTESVETFKTGVQYQMYHALFLLLLGMMDKVSIKTKKLVFVLVIIGLLFFSGSIYGLSTNELSSFDFKAIGFITPIGGLLLISSWLILGISILIKEQ